MQKRRHCRQPSCSVVTLELLSTVAIMFGGDVLLSESVDDDLYWACHSGSNKETIAKLVSHGASVNARVGKSNQMTPLLAAVAGGHVNTVRTLLECGADPNMTGAGGAGPTPLHTACRNGFQDLVRVLLKFGADVDSTDAQQNTPADLAGKIHHHNIIRMLNDHKMKAMLSGNDPNQSLVRGTSSSDFGLAAQELEGFPSMRNLQISPNEESRSKSIQADSGSSRQEEVGNGITNGSNDLQMLLAAHRQLTVRESGRDRRLQRIQDTVSEMQSGMNRMATVIDGLRIMLVESMKLQEASARADDKRSTEVNTVIAAELASLKLEHTKTLGDLQKEQASRRSLETKLCKLQENTDLLRHKEEEARVALAEVRRHFEKCADQLYQKKQELNATKHRVSDAGQNNKQESKKKAGVASNNRDAKLSGASADSSRAATVGEQVHSRHGSEARKRLALLAKEQVVSQSGVGGTMSSKGASASVPLDLDESTDKETDKCKQLGESNDKQSHQDNKLGGLHRRMSRPELSVGAIRRLSRTEDKLAAVLADPSDLETLHASPYAGMNKDRGQNSKEKSTDVDNSNESLFNDLWDVA